MVNTLHKFKMEPKSDAFQKESAIPVCHVKVRLLKGGVTPFFTALFVRGYGKAEIFKPMTDPWDEHRFFDRSHEWLDFLYGINE